MATSCSNHRTSSCNPCAPIPFFLTASLFVSMMSFAASVRADGSAGPWECSGYSGEAHTRCLQAFIELQRDKISKLEGELQAQQGSVNQLKEQVDRQSAATQDIQRQLSDTSSNYSTVPPVQSYVYPPVGLGLGLYLGSPWYYGYGSPYFYRPFFGPRIYIGPRGYFGPRARFGFGPRAYYGPRAFYGPRYYSGGRGFRRW